MVSVNGQGEEVHREFEHGGKLSSSPYGLLPILLTEKETVGLLNLQNFPRILQKRNSIHLYSLLSI